MKFRKHTFLIIIIFLALFLRVIYLYQMHKNDPFFYHLFSDPLQYHERALSILSHGIIGTEAFYHPPLYQYFIALLYAIFGSNPLVIRIFQVILGTVNVILVYILGRRYFNKTVAKIAGIITAVYPMLIFYDAELLMPTLVISLILLGLYFLLHSGNTYALIAGIIFGLAALARQNMLLIIVIFPLIFLIRYKKIAWRYVGLFWAGSLLMILPVTIRNIVVVKEPILISWQGGINFYIGNNPEADGITGIPPGSEKTDWHSAFLDLKQEMETEAGHSLSLSQIDRKCYPRGFKFISQQPFQALGLLIKKTYLFFGGFEVSSERDIYQTTQYSYLKFLLFKIPFLQFPFGLLFPLFLIGLYYSYSEWRRLSLPLLFITLYSISFIVFFVNARYRMVIIPILIIFAGYGIQRLIHQKNIRRLRVPLCIGIGSFILFNANIYGITDPSDYLTAYMVAQVDYSTGNYEKALRKVEESIKDNPDFAESQNLNGLILKAMGKTSEAEYSFHKAIAIDPYFADAYINLGNLAISQKNLQNAEVYYRKAIDISPASAVGHNNLGNIYFQKGLLDSALIYYQYALEKDHDYVSPIYHSALIHYTQGDTRTADTLCRRVLHIDNKHQGAKRILKLLSNGNN